MLARNLEDQVRVSTRRVNASRGSMRIRYTPHNHCSAGDMLGALQSSSLTRSSLLQITGTAKYSLDVAAAVFRIYQLQPSAANKDLIAKTLLRALMQLPRPDYRVLIHILPERLVVSAINTYHSLLLGLK